MVYERLPGVVHVRCLQGGIAVVAVLLAALLVGFVVHANLAHNIVVCSSSFVKIPNRKLQCGLRDRVREPQPISPCWFLVKVRRLRNSICEAGRNCTKDAIKQIMVEYANKARNRLRTNLERRRTNLWKNRKPDVLNADLEAQI